MDLRSSDPLDLDHARIDVFDCMARVARNGGKSRLRQVLEMLPLVLGHARISPSDYYRYRLYDDALHSAEEKRRFVGNNRYWDTTLRVCDSRWLAATDDKLVTATLLQNNGIVVPEIQAVYHRYRGFPGAATLTTPDELVEFLAGKAVYPLFGKPVSGFESKGAVLLKGFEAGRGEVIMHDGSRVPVGELAAAVEQFVYRPLPGFRRFQSQLGYMFQAAVEQHPALTEIAGETLASLRLYVVVEEPGPRILSAVWKLPAPGNFADNFLHSGNMMADLDLGTGEVTRVIRGTGLDTEELDTNPHTGQRLTGIRLPHFELLKREVLRGATLIPGIRVQGWDVAIGSDGPIVIEINNGSGYTAPQLASGRGFLDEDFARFLECAEEANETYPWKPFYQRQQHGHRFGRTRGLLRLPRRPPRK